LKKLITFVAQKPINNGLCAVWMFLSFYLFFTPNEKLVTITQINDKVGHFLFFGAMAILLELRGLKTIEVLLLLVAYALLVEFIQWLLPVGFKRGAELLDVIADAIGTILGISLAGIILKSLNE
jgi:VanZ family protein